MTLASVIQSTTCENLLGNNHEFLESQTATGVGATVQDVLEGNGQDVGLLGTGEVGDVDVERDTLLGGGGLGHSQGDTQNGVGTEVALVGRTIELVEELVDLGLVLDINGLLDKSGANDIVDVLHGLQDTCRSDNYQFRARFELDQAPFSLTLAAPVGLVTITELNGLVLA